jgi:hypothetical protein
MKILARIATNPLLIVVIMLKDLKDLIIDLKMMILSTNIQPSTNFDWWDFIIKLVIAIVLWLVLKSYFELKKRFEIQNILSSVRNKHAFLSSFQGIEFYRTPNETDESLFNRLPEGQYRDYLKDEYKYVKELIMKRYDLKPSEAQNELDKLYGIKRRKK